MLRRVARSHNDEKGGLSMTTDERLTEDEMVDILEDLARNSQSATARIQAIKTLREMRAGQKPVADGFAVLDEPGRRLKAV